MRVLNAKDYLVPKIVTIKLFIVLLVEIQVSLAIKFYHLRDRKRFHLKSSSNYYVHEFKHIHDLDHLCFQAKSELENIPLKSRDHKH